MLGKMLLKLKLLPRIFLLGIAVVLCFLVAMIFLYTEIRTSKYDAKRTQLKYLVETTSGILDYYSTQVTNGSLSEDDAKQKAIAAIRGLRYDDANYFWINDLQPRVVMHPTNTALEGTDVSDYKDPTGKKLFVEFVKVCKASGAGFVNYEWPKPGSTTPIPKISYVKLFAPWGWIVGTGVYVDDVEAEIAVLVRAALLAVGIAVVVGLAIAFVLARSISSPVARIAGTARVIAEGDLSQNIQYEAHDEIGDLAGALNQMILRLREALHTEQEQRTYLETNIDKYVAYASKVTQGDLLARIALDGNEHQKDDPLVALGASLNMMTDSLQKMIAQIRESSNNLSAASAEILAATTQQAAGASEQSAAISQTTTTVEEVKTISEQASMRSQEVASAAQRTVDVALMGQNAMQDTISSMGEIKERVESIAENILALSEQTQQIGEIIATVNEIASQSNMLALNASVEAARAGEHGKGFAVVAMEVRSLAEQSKQATSQVKAILSEIQKATNMTVMATEEGTKGVDRGVKLVGQAREAIEQLAAAINESAQIATQVVAGGQQQQTGIEQIALAMQNINQATVQGLASTRQAEKSAQSLNEMARKMADTVAQYKL